MKTKILSLAVVLLTLFSCSKENDTTYTINAHLSYYVGGKEATITLTCIEYAALGVRVKTEEIVSKSHNIKKTIKAAEGAEKVVVQIDAFIHENNYLVSTYFFDNTFYLLEGEDTRIDLNSTVGLTPYIPVY